MATTNELGQRLMEERARTREFYQSKKNVNGELEFTKEDAEELSRRETILADLQDQFTAARRSEQFALENEAKLNDLQSPASRLPIPMRPESGEGITRASFARRLVTDKRFANIASLGGSLTLEGETKTLFQTSAGWPPESVRSGTTILSAQRPLSLADVIPTSTLNQPAMKWMLETTFTNAAAEKAEGAAYAESTFVLTEQSAVAVKITNSLPVTDEQMEDVDQAEQYVRQRLIYGLQARFETQALTGDGVAPNLKGIFSYAGIQTQDRTGLARSEAAGLLISKIQANAFTNPDYFIFHPTDWWAMKLETDGFGQYLHGVAYDTVLGLDRLWGIPVVISTVTAQGTALCGDFGQFCNAGFIHGVDVQVGYNSSDFVQGKKTMRADIRVALAVYRPAAFGNLTNLGG